MDKTKKKKIKRAAALSLAVIMVLLLGFMPLLARQEKEEDGPKASILSGSAAMGSVDKEVIGGGVLSEEESASVSVLSEVKLKEFLVTNGQKVKKGDAIATVDRVTVMTAILKVQETLDYLAEEIESESKKETENSLVATVGGTVKTVYAKEGDSVQDVMLEHGALAVFSLDELMAVDLEVESTLSAGDSVVVTRADGSTAEGRISSNLMGKLTVTVEDQNDSVGSSVQVSAEDGSVIGSGELYIYSPWSVAAYTGVVSHIKISEGDRVSAGKTIIVLSHVGETATYQKLITQRQNYEEYLVELFSMYQTEQITSPCDGIISGVDENSLQLLNGEGNYTVSLLQNSPNGKDDTLYSHYVGKVSATGQNGWAMLFDPQRFSIADYKALPERLWKEAEMNEVVIYQPVPAEGAPIPVFELKEDRWETLNTQEISQGDILLFAEDSEGKPVWIVRLQKAEEDRSDSDSKFPSVDGSTGGDATVENNVFPTLPEENTNASTQTPSTESGTSSGQQNASPSGSASFPDSTVSPGMGSSSGGSAIGGNWGNSGGFVQTEPEFELYETAKEVIASVTPQDSMSLEITVDESDVNSLKTGMEASVKINALGGEKVKAVITQIGNEGTGNGGNSKFSVTFSFARSEDMLVGMNATACVVLETLEEVVTVPAKALVEEGNKTVLYTGYDEESETLLNPVEVKVGASDGETVQILEGIKSGETYYYAYYDTLEISFTPNFAGGGSMFGFSG